MNPKQLTVEKSSVEKKRKKPTINKHTNKKTDSVNVLSFINTCFHDVKSEEMCPFTNTSFSLS